MEVSVHLISDWLADDLECTKKSSPCRVAFVSNNGTDPENMEHFLSP